MSSQLKKPSVLAFTGYRDLWTGQLISSFGDVLHFIVFLWWAGVIAGPTGVGIVMSFSVGTYVLLAPLAGVVADRVDRRKILLISDLVCGTVVGSLVILALLYPKPPLWVLCAFAVALKCAFVFQSPAKNAAIARLVPEDRLLQANSLMMTAQTGMPLAGNALGALVLGFVFKMSASLAYVFTFALNSLTFFASAVFMARLPEIKPERDPVQKSAWSDTKEGIAFIFTHPVLRVCVVLFFCFEFFIAPFMPAYVVAAQTTFKSGFALGPLSVSGPALLSLLETGFFLGFVLGSWGVYRYPIHRAGGAFSLFVALSSLAIVPMGFVSSVPAFWVLNFLCGILMPFGVIPLQTFMQTATPDAFRGRVNAAIGTIAASAAPFGAMTAGVLLAILGLSGTFVFIGLGLAAASAFGLLSPAFRNAMLPQGVRGSVVIDGEIDASELAGAQPDDITDEDVAKVVSARL